MTDTTLRMLLMGEDVNASKTLKDVGDAGDKAHKQLHELGDGLSEAGGGMSKIMTIAGAAGPAILAAGAALSSAAAGGVALASAIGPAAAAGAVAYVGVLGAVKTAGLVTKFALDGVSQAVGGNKAAMKALTPEGRQLVRTLQDLKPQLTEIRSAVQQGLFPGLEQATSQLSRNYLPLLKTAAAQTGDALGGLASGAANMASTGPWRRDFATLTQANAHNIANLGGAGLNLADALRSLLVTAAPLSNAFSEWAYRATRVVDAWVQAKRETGELSAFWEKASATAHVLGSILGNLAAAMGNVFKIGAAGAGAGLLKSIEKITEQFRAWTGSANGAKAIADWFNTGRQNLEAMGHLVHDVLGGMQGIGSGQALAPLIDQLRTEVLPPLMEFLHNASASGALGALVHAVAGVVQVFADLSASDSSLKAFAATLGILATSAGWIIENVPGASQAMAAFFIAAGASQALKLVGLGRVVTALGGYLSTLATRFLVAAGAETTESGAIRINTLARSLSTGMLGTWIGVKYLELTAWLRSTAATVASTTATIAQTVAQKAAALASKAWAAAQWLLNAALDANPIALVVIGIAALVAALILAYKHSATFRAIVQGAFHAVAAAAQAAFGWIKDHWKLLLAIITGPIGLATLFVISHWKQITGAVQTAISWITGHARSMWDGVTKALGSTEDWIHGKWNAIVGWLGGLGGRISGAVGGMFSGVTDAFRSAIDAVIGIWNGLHFSIPSIHAFGKSVGGGTISTPNLPYLGAGGVATGAGMVRVGDRGPEDLYLPPGALVRPLSPSERSGDAAGDLTLTLVLKSEDGRVTHKKLLKLKRENGNLELGLA